MQRSAKGPKVKQTKKQQTKLNTKTQRAKLTTSRTKTKHTKPVSGPFLVSSPEQTLCKNIPNGRQSLAPKQTPPVATRRSFFARQGHQPVTPSQAMIENITRLVQDIGDHCDDLAKKDAEVFQAYVDNPQSIKPGEEQPSNNAVEFTKIKNMLIASAKDPQKFGFNYFMAPCFYRIQNLTELRRYCNLRNPSLHPAVQEMANQGVQMLRPAIDVDFFLTFCDSASLTEMKPLFYSHDLPTNPDSLDSFLSTVLRAQHELVDSKRLTPRAIGSAYKLRVASARGNTIGFWRDIMDLLIKGVDFETGIHFLHKHLLSFAIPVTSPAHRDYKPPAIVKAIKDKVDGDASSSTSDHHEGDKGEEKKEGAEAKEAETTAEDGKSTQSQDDSETGSPSRPSPFPVVIDPSSLETKLKIPEKLKEAGTVDDFLVEIATQLKNKKPSTDPEALTQQLNDLLDQYDRVVVARGTQKIDEIAAKVSKKSVADMKDQIPWTMPQRNLFKQRIDAKAKSEDAQKVEVEVEVEVEAEAEGKTTQEGQENKEQGEEHQEQTDQNVHVPLDSESFRRLLIPSLSDLIANPSRPKLAEHEHDSIDQNEVNGQNDQNDQKTHENGHTANPKHPLYDPIYPDYRVNGSELLLSDLSVPLVSLDGDLDKDNEAEAEAGTGTETKNLPTKTAQKKKRAGFMSSTRVWGHRPNQQDHHLVAPQLLDGDLGLFGVFDGAGSEYVSQWMASSLVDRMQGTEEWQDLKSLSKKQKSDPQIIQPILNTMMLKLYPALSQEIGEWSQEIYRSKASQGLLFQGISPTLISASTCVIALHHRPSSTLNISHVGDSLALLAVDPEQKTKTAPGDNGQSFPDYHAYNPYIVTREHKPDQPEELKRVKAAGGSVEFVGPTRLPYLECKAGTLNMSRAFGGISFRDVGLISTPNIINLTIKSGSEEGDSGVDKTPSGEVADEVDEQGDGHTTGLSTPDLLAKYNTDEHLANYQKFNTLDQIPSLNHFPSIRYSTEPFAIKSLTLGSDGLYETIPEKDMIDIPLHRFFMMEHAASGEGSFDPLAPALISCFRDPFHSHQHLGNGIEVGFDAKWNASPSDALVSQVLSRYHPTRYPSDNITGVVVFF